MFVVPFASFVPPSLANERRLPRYDSTSLLDFRRAGFRVWSPHARGWTTFLVSITSLYQAMVYSQSTPGGYRRARALWRCFDTSHDNGRVATALVAGVDGLSSARDLLPKHSLKSIPYSRHPMLRYHGHLDGVAIS